MSHAEGLAAHYREDKAILIRQWLAEGKIIEDVIVNILEYETNGIEVQKMLRETVSVDLQSCVNLNKILEKIEMDTLRDDEFLAQPNDEHGRSPPSLYN